MERITYHLQSKKKKDIKLVFRLRNGRDVQIHRLWSEAARNASMEALS